MRLITQVALLPVSCLTYLQCEYPFRRHACGLGCHLWKQLGFQGCLPCRPQELVWDNDRFALHGG